ncbi:uncharacterized protein isoform X1 [Choristoneura fumiferana]|uniref:uncharacterized protein isoform X1 n=1 Tax=Choristoneura fumiferana TaxID=7141 RepID=UPI003D15E5E7
MPFVKDTSYRDIPFSPESPCTDDFHYFVSVKQLIEEIKCHRDMLRCRTVGTVSSDYGKFVIHELDDSSVQIRLSLARSCEQPPSALKPYAAQVFGFVRWKDSVGPVILPYVLQVGYE